MPRPKRTKVAPSIPATGGVGRANLNKAREVLEDISDEGERRAIGVRRVKEKHGANTGMQADNVSRFADAGWSTNSVSRKRLEEQKKKAEAAMGRLEAENFSTSAQVPSTSDEDLSSPVVEVGRRAMPTPAAATSALALGNFRRRSRQPSILRRSASRARSSSVESNLAESHGLTNIHARKNSFLARGGFRRRQRQPSILGRAHSRVRSSSVDFRMDYDTPGHADSEVEAGILSTRSRRSSTSGMRNRERGRAREVDYDEDGDEDEFNPDDESTPLNLSKTPAMAEQDSQSDASAVNPRKRKLSSLASRSSSLRLPAHGSEAKPDSPSSPPRTPVAAEVATPTTPEHLSDIMAPPRSSSPPEAAPEILLPSRRTAMQPSARSTRRQPARRPLAPPNPDSLPSSPPSLTHSPNQTVPSAKRQVRGRTRTRPQPADYSTLQLQAMLPRRRRRVVRDPFELASSEDTELDVANLGSDEDELTHLTTRSHRTANRVIQPSLTTPGPSNQPVSRSKPLRKPKATPLSKSAAASASAARTRQRNTTSTSDKENQPDSNGDVEGVFHSDAEVDPDDSLAPLPEPEDAEEENSQELEARVGKELKDAKRKFEVVDRWELEFEDCTGSSSPWEGR